MKIGFLLCAYNQEEFVHDCLKDLVKFSKENGHIISAVSVPFEEYKDMEVEPDDTTEILEQRLIDRDIDFLVDKPKFVSEAEARNNALQLMLLLGDVDAVWMIDSDEIYQYEELEKIQNYVENSEFIDWFTIPFKNYVGEGYLEEPFTPPRIFKTKTRGMELSHFYFDNDLVYKRGDEEVNYKSLSSKNIPKETVWIKHLSWTNTEKNKSKILYQQKHFAPTGCSYEWDDKKGIVFNDKYFQLTNQQKPKIIYDR